MAKLKWRRRAESSTKSYSSEELEDERGVTMCALEEDGRYQSEFEEGEQLENLDVTITALNRDESS
jgi:hypothetical protein